MKKIIVVGQYPPMLSLISEVLSERGFAVKTARSKDEVSAAHPDLILVDLDHPEAAHLLGRTGGKGPSGPAGAPGIYQGQRSNAGR